MDTLTSPRFLLIAGLWCATTVGATAADSDVPVAPGAIARDALILNEDNSHFYGSRRAEDMTLEGLNAFIDQYAGTSVTHLFLCPNAMRASFRSRSRDAIWDLTGQEIAPSAKQSRWPDNARLLHERGLDPYSVWIARCREKRISPWLSMRMNDVHGADDEKNFMHSSFWRAHPEYRRVPHGGGKPWTDRALNYAHPEVREHNLAFVRELLERYDPDGLELDWMRFGWHLTPRREREEGPLLSGFVREVRMLVREWSAKRGHPIHLAVRIPAHPDAAAGLGMDGVSWAREGLVDVLTPCPFWTTSDFDIPVELWKERLGERAAKLTVAPGLEFNARPWPAGKSVANDLAAVYGFAAAARTRGADAIYLFNFMDSGTRPVSASNYRTLIEKGVGDNYVVTQERRFPVCFRDTVPNGFPNGVMLPVKGRTGATFRIHVGSVPAAAQACVIFGLATAGAGASDIWDVTVNGRPTESGADLADITGLGGAPARAIQFAVPEGALQSGYNQIAVRQKSDGSEKAIVWAEIRLRPDRTSR